MTQRSTLLGAGGAKSRSRQANGANSRSLENVLASAERPDGASENRKMLWGRRRGNGNFVAASNRWSAAMPQPNDLSRSLVALDQNSTIIAVVELSQSSWLVAGM